VCLPPHQRVHTRRAVRGLRKTPDIGLASYSIIPLRCLPSVSIFLTFPPFSAGSLAVPLHLERRVRAVARLAGLGAARRRRLPRVRRGVRTLRRCKT
jgi:hypothetical protein